MKKSLVAFYMVFFMSLLVWEFSGYEKRAACAALLGFALVCC